MSLLSPTPDPNTLVVAAIRQQHRRQNYIQIFLTLLVIGFFLFFAIKPTLNTVISLNREIQDKRLVENQLDAKITALMAAQKQYTTVENRLNLINEALPAAPELSLLLKQVEYFARQNSLNLENAQVDQTLLFGQEKGSPDVVVITLALTGSYDNLKNLLAQINQSRRLVTLKSFTFKIDPKNKEQMHLSLNLKAYLFKE